MRTTSSDTTSSHPATSYAMSGLGLRGGACVWITGFTRALLAQLLLTAMGMTAGPAQAQDCQDSGPSKGEVAVASVFATLGFVGLVLVIAYVILRRRQGGFLFPPKRTRRSKRAEDAEEGEGGRGDHRANCYDNQAFASADTQESHGRDKSSPRKKNSPSKNSPSKDKGKTWASFPWQHNDSDTSLERKGSCGSLDNNFGGPETVSVWLQSQDIVGLGFEISGNMRDGIFVSQVHNRGPAVESGKIKVGDRIVSVTITYDHMVFEDALTILSYASPYPVKVTLQKERAAAAAAPAPEASRPASREQLNHPLYRSQSLDTLQRAAHRQRHQEALPAFRAKRTQSEMKCETRGSWESPRKREGGWAGESGMLQSCPAPSPSSFTSPYTHHRSDVEVHTPQVCGKEVTQNAAVELPTSGQVGDAGTDGRTRKNSHLDTEAAREFADLMDRMTEEKKEREEDGVFSVSPKTPPSKPQRKNKPSSSSLEDMSGIVEEETVQTTMAAPAQTATPPRPQSMGTREEAEEEQIRPAHVKREVVIGSENIQFTAIDPHADPVRKADSLDGFVSVSLTNDQDDTQRRPPSPQELPVSEEVIKAVKVVKEVQIAPLPSLAQQTPVEKKKKEKPKGPMLDEEELERLIAMNSFPPGTQGLAGIRAGGKEGGVHDNFLPRELNGPAGGAVAHSRNGSGSSSSASSSSDGRGQSQTRVPRGGVAFEVRDDVLTGRPVSVDLTASRSRNASLSPSREGRGASGSLDRIGRASSLRDDHHHHHHHHNHDLPQKQPREPPLEGRSARHDFEKHSGSQDGLEWSGMRLVRSGSFQLIPQDEASLGDWTDRDKVKAENDDDDDRSTESGNGSRPSTAKDAASNPADSEGSSEAELALHPLSDKNFFKAQENLASLSDLSNSLSSSSSSSSGRSSAPSPPPSLNLNGPSYSEPDGRLRNSQSSESSGSSFILVEKPPADDHNGNSKSPSSLLPLGVSVTLTRQDDMDC